MPDIQINFYHLTQSPLGKALPKLLEKVVGAGMRAVVKLENEEIVEKLNTELWTYTTKFFLPHGSSKDGFAEQQPIYLTSENDNPAGATIFVFAGNAEPADLSGYSKCLYMFDGNDAAQLQNARNYWKKYKDAGFELTYWQQSDKGAWVAGSR